jgi:hypothetical protein
MRVKTTGARDLQIRTDRFGIKALAVDIGRLSRPVVNDGAEQNQDAQVSFGCSARRFIFGCSNKDSGTNQNFQRNYAAKTHSVASSHNQKYP